MFSLYIENFLSFSVIMLLLWFDFHRNMPCLCYSIRTSPSDTAAEIVPMKYTSCLSPPYLTLQRCVETLHNIY